jgi:hypothetical protein
MIRALVALLLVATAVAADRVPPRDPLPADRAVLAYLVIPDLPRLLAHAEAAVTHVRELPEGMLVAQAAGLIGDPGFSALDPSKPIVVALLAPSDGEVAPGFAAWIPAKDPARYVAAARTWKLVGAAGDGVAIIAKDQAAVTRAQGLAQAYAAMAKPVDADLRLRVACARAWTFYGDALRDHAKAAVLSLAALPRPAGAPDLGPVVRFELAVALAIAQDLQDLQFDLSISGDALSETIELAAQPGSALAAALVAPPVGAGAAAAAVLGPGDGTLTMTMGLDPHATGTFLTTLLRRAASEEHVQVDPGVVDLLDHIGADTTGGSAIRLAIDAGGHLRMAYLLGTTSAAAGKQLAERNVALFAADAPLARLYAKLGLPMTMSLAEDTRTTHGVPVAKLGFDLDLARVRPEQRAVLESLGRGYELAFAEHWMLAAQDPAELDALAERTQAAPAAAAITKAEATLGAGRDIYVDYDVARLTAASLVPEAQPNPQVQRTLARLRDALAAVPPGDPITVAGTLERGQARWQLRLPLAPFAAMAKAAMAAVPPGGNAAPAPDDHDHPAPPGREF